MTKKKKPKKKQLKKKKPKKTKLAPHKETEFLPNVNEDLIDFFFNRVKNRFFNNFFNFFYLKNYFFKLSKSS